MGLSHHIPALSPPKNGYIRLSLLLFRMGVIDILKIICDVTNFFAMEATKYDTQYYYLRHLFLNMK